MSLGQIYVGAEVVRQFEAVMHAAGIAPEYPRGSLAPNGELIRFRVEGDSKDSKNGWAVLHGDGIPAGMFGNWKTGESHSWCAKRDSELTADERAEQRRRVEMARAERERAEKQCRAEAAEDARVAWEAAKPATSHPYLQRKCVRSHGLRVASADGNRVRAGDLLIPLHTASGVLVSLQRITQDSAKFYLAGGEKRGCFYRIGGKGPAWLVEGYATGVSVHEATGQPVVVAFDAGGLKSVADVLRRQLLGVAADNDESGTGQRAAEATGLPWIVPPTMGQDWNDYAVEHGLDAARAALVLPAASNISERDEARRRQQKEENVRLQDDARDTAPPRMSLSDMLDDCVWITAGCQVGRVSRPQAVLAFNEFCDLTASCLTAREDNPTRSVPTAVLWKKHGSRKTVETRTFRAGATEICLDPDGATALNSWRLIERRPSSADVAPFLDHVAYLFEDVTEREVFLDWLAHIEQKPGVLPHYGWLHIAKNTGTGRNWMASVLSRVWRGYVAPNVDLPGLLESQFNGMLAGRLLAMVDEVQEGGGDNQFRHANRLNAIINAEERAINPKFGRQFKEHNSCRWLVFSNYENALPMKDTDRRWRVVRHSAAPRSPGTYAKLYALLDDAEFIHAIGWWLRERDIGAFNPGERPPMNEAKRAALAASRSLIQQSTGELISRWPVDIITGVDAAEVLCDGADNASITPAMRRALNEAGALQYGGGRVVKVRHRASKCWILRNVERWQHAAPIEIATEAVRARELNQSATALEVLVGADDDGGSPL